MFLSISFIFGILTLLLLLAFLGAAVYHLMQYRLPKQSLTKILTALILVSLTLAGLSAFLFLTIPWKEL